MAEKIGLKSIKRMDGRLHVFCRPNSSKIWCGFHYKGRYVRKSTGCTIWSDAIQVAEDWFFQRQAEIRSGLQEFGGVSFRNAAKKTISSLSALAQRGERSKDYISDVSEIIERRLIPFFGSTSVDKIGIVQWERYKSHELERSPNLARGTLHQHKNALRLVLNESYRRGWIKQIPVFKDVYSNEKVKVPRIWLSDKEYSKIHRAIREHRKSLLGTRWTADCDELYDYVIFVTNSGLRPSEAMKVRFCDVSINEESDHGEKRQFLMIENISGKRGGGDCRTMEGAVVAFQRRIAARGIVNPRESTERLFKAYHRDMFTQILEQTGLRYSREQPPRKRDLTVLRHTYIVFRLLRGNSVWDIANNCRTSPAMIKDHYARWLSPRLTKSLSRLKPINEEKF